LRRGIAALLAVFSLAALPAAAAERYHCVHIIDEGGGVFRADRKQTVDLTVDGQTIHTRLDLEAATAPLTFRRCSPVASDGSDFSRWFAHECRNLHGAERPAMMDVFLTGAYAGISPRIGPGYVLHSALARAAAAAGIAMPERTVVIYVERKPEYEFLCHPK
jgi:hypothetical protein